MNAQSAVFLVENDWIFYRFSVKIQQKQIEVVHPLCSFEHFFFLTLP